MITYKLKLEVFEDGKNVMNLMGDETVITDLIASKIIKMIFAESEKSK